MLLNSRRIPMTIVIRLVFLSIFLLLCMSNLQILLSTISTPTTSPQPSTTPVSTTPEVTTNTPIPSPMPPQPTTTAPTTPIQQTPQATPIQAPSSSIATAPVQPMPISTLPPQQELPAQPPVSMSTPPEPAPMPAAQPEALTIAPVQLQKPPTTTSKISKQENEQINIYLQTIIADKELLKKMLADIDKDIEIWKSMILQARKRSMEILNQPDPMLAKQIRTEFEQHLINIKTVQQNMQNSIAAKFQTTYTEIQQAAESIQQLLKNITEESTSVPSQPQEISDVTSVTQNTSATLEKKEVLTLTTESTAEKTFVHYFFNRFADLITGAAQIIYTTFISIKESVLHALLNARESATSQDPISQSNQTQAIDDIPNTAPQTPNNRGTTIKQP